MSLILYFSTVSDGSKDTITIFFQIALLFNSYVLAGKPRDTLYRSPFLENQEFSYISELRINHHLTMILHLLDLPSLI